MNYCVCGALISSGYWCSQCQQLAEPYPQNNGNIEVPSTSRSGIYSVEESYPIYRMGFSDTLVLNYSGMPPNSNVAPPVFNIYIRRTPRSGSRRYNAERRIAVQHEKFSAQYNVTKVGSTLPPPTQPPPNPNRSGATASSDSGYGSEDFFDFDTTEYFSPPQDPIRLRLSNLTTPQIEAITACVIIMLGFFVGGCLPRLF